SHDVNRTWSSGHDSGTQRLELDAAEAWMLQLRDEHRRYAIDGRTPVILNRLQRGIRIERLARNDDGAAVRDRRHVAKHAAKAVIERDRQANPVAFRVAQYFANEVTVIEDVVVRERRTFRR